MRRFKPSQKIGKNMLFFLIYPTHPASRPPKKNTSRGLQNYVGNNKKLFPPKRLVHNFSSKEKSACKTPQQQNVTTGNHNTQKSLCAWFHVYLKNGSDRLFLSIIL